jgi:hypothetical protein
MSTENMDAERPEVNTDSTKPAANEAVVREFLTTLCGHFAPATDGLDRPGWMQLTALYPDDKSKLLPRRFRIDDVDGMTQHAMDYAAGGHNVYVEARTVGELPSNKRGALKDTRWVVGLVVDSDGDKGMAGTIPAGATLIVESSGDTGNTHHWFIFDRAIHVGEAQEIGKAMRAAIGADHDTGTITQPYRLAGTPNFPSPSKRKERN